MPYPNVLNHGAALGGRVSTVGILAPVWLHLRVYPSVAFQIGVTFKRLGTAGMIVDEFDVLLPSVFVH